MRSPTVHILLYHEIAENDDQVKIFSNPMYTTPLLRFKDHLRWLKRSSYKPIRLNEWLDARKNGEVGEGKFVLLTFDGPHAGWFEYVLPTLVEMEMPATFFVIAGWVGEKHAFSESRHIRWDHVAKIETLRDRQGRQLFDVGCHSMWHTTLDKKASETQLEYEDRLEEEITVATGLIRERTGCSVRSYATPEGQGDAGSLNAVFKKAGIEAVRWATLPGRKNNYMCDLYDLQISFCDISIKPSDQLSIVLSGPVTAFLKRAVRRLRAELIYRANR